MTDEQREYQRALARERQRRSRSRRRHAVTGVVTDRDTGKPSLTVTRVARNLLAGMSDRQALREAGSSEKSVALLDKARFGLAEVLKEHGLTTAKIASSTKESIDATSPMLTADGSIDRPDWTARAAGRRDAIALLDRAGELPSIQQADTGRHVSVTFNTLNLLVTPQDMVTDSQFTSAADTIDTQVIATSGDSD